MIWTARPRADFGEIRAIRCGTGPRVLLLHGVGLRAEAWAAQIEALSAEFSIIAPDMPGHGASARLDGRPTLSDYVDAIASAMDAPALVAGHSMGAMIALELAALHPDKVRAVAALNAIYRRDAEAQHAVAARAAALRPDRPADPSPTLARWFGEQRSAEAEACCAWLTATDPAGYRDAYRVFAAEDGPTDAALEALTCPALFATGGAEPNSTPAMSEAMAARAPDGRVRVLPGAAHMMPMTHAADVSEVLRSFFAEALQGRPATPAPATHPKRRI